jgi:flagellar hook-associated protein 1
MSLSSVFQIAQNSLSSMTRRTAVLSRNVNDASNPDYARRELQTITSINGSQTLSVRRAADMALEKAALTALSNSAGQTLLSQRLGTLHGLLGGEGSGTLIQDRLTALHNGLQTLSASPANETLAISVLGDAKSLVGTIRTTAADIQTARSEADEDIGSLVAELNTLLGEFKLSNDAVKQGTQLGQDVNDAIDRRSAVLKQISEIVPVNSIVRDSNDLVLMTASGATLFETNPRNISFSPSAPLAASTSGEPVVIDFTRFSIMGNGQAEATGKLDALLRLRDTILPGMQRQLDEFAHGLISSFAETDLSGVLAPMQGLFAWSGGPAIPSEGILTDGMSELLSINSLYDPNSGGSLTRLRDGGANGAAYNANPSGSASFADRLISLLENIDETRQFSPAAELGDQSSVTRYAGQMGAWFSEIRSNAQSFAGMAETRHSRFSEQLSNRVGVNIDDEMILLGQLEHSYEASARLLKVADQMLQDLLAAVG